MKKKKSTYYVTAVMIFAVFVITFLMGYKMSGVPKGDYEWHILQAEKLKYGLLYASRELGYPLGMYHVLMFFTMNLGIPARIAAAFISACAGTMVYLLVLIYYKKICGCNIKNSLYYTLIGVLLLIVTPLYIPSYNKELYLGQGAPNTWHNPTNLMVKPFAVLAFVLFLLIIREVNAKKSNIFMIMFFSIILCISCFAKASLVQFFLPGVGVYLGLEMLKNRNNCLAIKSYLAIGCSMIPAFLFILFQAYEIFDKTSSNHIMIAPFKVVKYYAPSCFVSLLLAIGLPLLITICWRDVLKKAHVKLAWILLFSGYMEWILLAEEGPRLYHCNFIWGYNLALFLLYMCMMGVLAEKVMLYMKNRSTVEQKKILVTCILGAIQIIDGIYYYLYLLTTAKQC
ncbi:hypothetical protein SAMN02910301_0436 [Lachnospiraceae bacterium XBD2001]|nr:hypothetical protein SAMN02910301_0436 [Lachnospiraceae bacterium XBD2001]